MNLLKAASTVSLLTLASRITGLVRELRLGGRVSAEHDRFVRSVCNRDKFQTAHWTDDELRARGDGGAAGCGVEHRAHAHEGALPKLLAYFTNCRERIGSRHRDFDGNHTTGQQCLGNRHGLRSFLRADDGDYPGDCKLVQDFISCSHNSAALWQILLKLSAMSFAEKGIKLDSVA